MHPSTRNQELDPYYSGEGLRLNVVDAPLSEAGVVLAGLRNYVLYTADGVHERPSRQDVADTIRM